MRRARLFADALTISRPVLVEPVNMTFATSLWAASAAPISRPPEMPMSTSSGRCRFISSMTASTDSGVYSLGFATTVLPIRSAGAICQIAISAGQFHGLMAPTTPSGT